MSAVQSFTNTANAPTSNAPITGAQLLGPTTYNQDPNAIKTTLNGVNYNFAGDVVPSAAPAAITPPPVPTAPAPVYAPKLDVAAINTQARADAGNAVNPLYSLYLNQLLADSAAKQQQQQQQTATNIQNAKDTLKQVQDANALTGTRVTADTATKLGDVNTAQDQNQQDTGTSFEEARLAQAKQQATAGVLGSGAGNRQTNTAIIQRNTTEGRQNDAFQEQKDAAELDKSRTFEDLANSNTLAGSAEGKTESQANFDLGNYIQNLNFQTTKSQNDLETARQNQLDATAKQLSQNAYAKYLNNISDPATKVAAAQTYGSSF